MNDLVSPQQIRRHMQSKINLRDERIRGLEQQVAELKAEREDVSELKTSLITTVEMMHKERNKLTPKAKAWDDLEALMSSDKGPLLIGYSEYNGQSLVKYNGVFYGCNSVIEGVSNALESIRENNNA